MKLKRYIIAKATLACIGLVLGHGAQADTVIDFGAFPPGQVNNANIVAGFGDSAAASSEGVTVNGFGTPNIDLSWEGVGGQWQYYIDSVWSAGQLDSSGVGDQHNVVFTPNNPGAGVVIKSLNFHPYYSSTERYTYNWAVLNGETSVASGSLTFVADATKNHPVEINYTGPAGATLTLQLLRVASTLQDGEVEGGTQNIAVDDILFGQFPETPLVTAPVVVSVTPADGQTGVTPNLAYEATISDGDLKAVAESFTLQLNGMDVSPAPEVTQMNGQTTVRFAGAEFRPILPPGSTNRYTLRFEDDGDPASSYTNEVTFVVAQYEDKSLPAPIVFEDFDSTPEGSLPDGWTVMSFADVDVFSEPNINFTNLDSAAYTNWVIVDASRFTGTFDTYSQLYNSMEQPAGEATAYQRVLGVNLLNIVDGAFVTNLASGRFAFANSGYRLGVRGQIMYLFTPDFDLSGHTDVYLVFHSIWEQNQDSIASVEYSIDMGATWLPALYMLHTVDVVRTMGEINPVATFTNSYADVPIFDDDADGLGEYGAFIGVAPEQWPNLAPFISPRIEDSPTDSKRIECLRLAQADNQASVRFRFAHAGLDSWYFGIDNFGLYSMPNQPVIDSIVRDGSNVIVRWSGAPNVKLQQTTSLVHPISWTDVPGTEGASQATIPITGEGGYFVLVTF